MKYALLVFILPVFLYAGNDSLVPNEVEQQLALQKQRDELISCIAQLNEEKFEQELAFFNGERVKAPKKNLWNISENYLNYLAFKNSEITQYLLPKKKEPKLTKKDIKQQVKEKVKAKKYQCLNDKDHWKSHMLTKLWTGLNYLGAAFGLWTLGYLCYKGCIEEIEYTPTEQFIYNCLGIHPIIVPLTSNPKTAYTLMGFCAASTYYATKEVYESILLKTHINQNLESARAIEQLIKKAQEKKEN